MDYTAKYSSPLGDILLAASEDGLTGLWFSGQKYYARTLPQDSHDEETEILTDAKVWLDHYFSGRTPRHLPPLAPRMTPFQKRVSNIMLTIPWGNTRSYGEIARQIAREDGLRVFSAQAVGGAVAHNPISLIIPCHRVLGSHGRLTGYAGGLDKKRWLLQHEGVFIPTI